MKKRLLLVGGLTAIVLIALAVPRVVSYLFFRGHARGPAHTLKKMADSARAYYESEQLFCKTLECDEPWHRDEDMERGRIVVPYDKHVFPGGTNQRLSTCDELPQAGEKYQPRLSARRHLEETLALFLVDFSEERQYCYTYETSGEAGPNAKATFLAQHDFDPSNPEAHTVEMELGWDAKQQKLVLSPRITRHEFQ